MTAYYNEIHPGKAAWLQELVDLGVIAPGVIDTRSIHDVQAADLTGFAQCHFFAGIGIWSAALRQAGWSDDRPVWTGSCPCQPFSTAGRRKGFKDERHLWPEFYRLVRQCRPATVFGEQVAGSPGERWFDHVSTDLEASDYACGAITFPACSIGAPHIRQRLYWMAYANSSRQSRQRGSGAQEDERTGEQGAVNGFWRDADRIWCRDEVYRPVKPGTFPLVDGHSASVVPGGDTIQTESTGEERRLRLQGYGDAIVLPQAVEFIKLVV